MNPETSARAAQPCYFPPATRVWLRLRLTLLAGTEVGTYRFPSITIGDADSGTVKPRYSIIRYNGILGIAEFSPNFLLNPI